MAKAARRATPATRGQHSRAEVKRGAAAKAAAEASAAARLGKIRKRPVQQPGANAPHRCRAARSAGRCRPLIRREAAVDTSTWPVLAIVGRPNVGKSTLFNRLTSSRRSIVGDEPGITRDRIYGEIEWSGQHARVVDTGGILPDDPELIPSEIFRQARVALDEADSIVMVVDGRTPLAAPDYDLARLLLRGGKPLLLAVNKMDTERWKSKPPSTAAWAFARCCLSPPNTESAWASFSIMSSPPFPSSVRRTHRWKQNRKWQEGRRGTAPDPWRVPAARNLDCHHRPAQCRQEHTAERPHRLFARDCFSHSGNDARCGR